MATDVQTADETDASLPLTAVLRQSRLQFHLRYKRLEETTFTWPAVRDGVMALNRAQFEALFAGLDWRKVKALETQRPAAAE